MWTIHLTYHASFFMHTVIFLLGLQLPTLGSSAILSLLGFHTLCKTPLTDCARMTFHGLRSSSGSDSPHQAMVSYPTWKLPALCLGSEPPYLAPLLSLLWHPPLCHCCLQPSSQCRESLVLSPLVALGLNFSGKGGETGGRVIFIY